MKEKQILRAAYKRWSLVLEKDQLPTFPSLKGTAVVTDAYVLAAGKVLRDGKEIEYQEVRVYLEPTSE